jgi:hypothetical protein
VQLRKSKGERNGKILWIERRREKIRKIRKAKEKQGKRKPHNIYYLVVLYGSTFVGLEAVVF